MRPERAHFRSERGNSRPEIADLGFKRAEFRAERLDGGDAQTSPCVTKNVIIGNQF